MPSLDTPLTSLLTTSPIKFTVIENNLPITVTIINDIHSMKVKCLFLIARQPFNIKVDYYQ